MRKYPRYQRLSVLLAMATYVESLRITEALRRTVDVSLAL
jgi:hypothetical protein